MPLPIDDLTTIHLDASTDDPSQARVEMLAVVNKTKAIIAVLDDGAGSGINADMVDGQHASSLTAFVPAGIGAVTTTTQIKNRQRKSFLDWMSDALKLVVTTRVYTAQNRVDMYTALATAWDSALLNGHDLYAPAGLYEIGEQNMPWRNPQFPNSSVLDCKNVTIYGDGEATKFATYSVGGADVFQLNGIKNFHVHNLAITATLTGSAGAGSNGISITAGFDNITLMDIYVHDLPGLDKGTYIDGGKGLSLQAWPTVNPFGALRARIHVKNCAEGFGAEPDLDNASTKAMSVDVDVIAERCYQAVKIASAAAIGTIPAGWSLGIRVKGQAINCQKDVIIGRMHGVDVDVQVVTTLTAAARTLRPNTAIAWFAADVSVESLVCLYAKNSRISVAGYKGGCNYKARIGGTSGGTVTGSTVGCEIYLDVGGIATTADLLWVDSGGNSIDNCWLFISNSTSTAAPVGFYTPALNNVIVNGPTYRLRNPLVSGVIGLTGADGKTISSSIGEAGGVPTVKQMYASAGSASIMEFISDAGARVVAVRNDGAIMTSQQGTASAVATVKGVMPIYNGSNVFIGYIPIYTTYTA